MLDFVVKHAKSYGLKINIDKIKLMKIDRKTDTNLFNQSQKIINQCGMH